jgi:periplasmic divalent cation tolerance protein
MTAADASGARVVLITHPQAGAEAFARGLVERGLAACVNLVPVTSVYRWQGKVETDPEVLLIAKTCRERVPELERVLADEHPYEVPECVALEPAAVQKTYLAWLMEETRE